MSDSAPSVARPARAAFTLLELLAVLAIVALLGALLFPAVEWARESGRSAACASNLRQLAAAALAHAESHGGEFPWGLRQEGGRLVCWDFVTGPDGRAAPGAGAPSGGQRAACGCQRRPGLRPDKVRRPEL